MVQKTLLQNSIFPDGKSKNISVVRSRCSSLKFPGTETKGNQCIKFLHHFVHGIAGAYFYKFLFYEKVMKLLFTFAEKAET